MTTKTYKVLNINEPDQIVDIIDCVIDHDDGTHIETYHKGGFSYMTITAEDPDWEAIAQQSDGLLENIRGAYLEEVNAEK